MSKEVKNKDKIKIDGQLFSKKEFREIEEFYRKSNGEKILKKIKEGEYKTLFHLKD